ncbi:MAG: hypothetical protein A2W93_00560 [Bacteroidetes bacterium GWF2_43_63]|nr:MAG: hypothetical protein A2W94_12960 [Bacteroidetes bacterium GWE2_42_42]OFY53891.1 MAG: hypothetical protein A2W93_00560 [Bacteroidetes bacterium GWF2_43_63]HBG69856.1 hypothetical protein [Bacteroidales bacterium]HCB60947.1 hypothetical protein [Bacteroidales bacterium]HCY24503.1 hypothetical protein [Bacteroidales bacterium]
MKAFYLYLMLFVLLTAYLPSTAQEDNEIFIGATSEEYSIRADVDLEFVEAVYCANTKDTLHRTLHLLSPLFIQFNKADLENFLKKPEVFINHVDPLISTTYVYSDHLGNNEIVPGNMKTHDVSFADNQTESWTRDVSGERGTALFVGFSILNFAESLKKTEKPLFTLLFKLDPCVSCIEKNVSGKAVFKSNNNPTITVTEGLSLDAEFSHEYLFYPALAIAVTDAGLTETLGKERDEFEENFKKQFYANAPKIDAEKMIRFLLQPSGTLEIPFEGSIKSDANCRQNNTFKGVIKVYGNQVYRFMSAE